MKKWTVIVAAICLVYGVTGTLCAEGVTGAGATFPALLLKKMFARYQFEAGVTVNYEPVGSFSGLQQLSESRVHFSVNDVQSSEFPMSATHRFVDVPITLGAVALIYNIPGVPVLKLTPEMVAEVFSGQITHWNDRRIAEVNPKVTLPNLPIILVERSDNSGTSALINRFLRQVDSSYTPSSDWVLNHAGARQVSGNGDLVAKVLDTPGSFGYTEWHYAVQGACGIVALRNPAGHYVLPSVESMLASMEDVPVEQIPVSGINSKNDYAYPIVGFSWVSTNADQSAVSTYPEAKQLVDLLWWASHQGQLFAEDNGFAPLPPAAMRFATQQLKKIQFDGVIIR